MLSNEAGAGTSSLGHTTGASIDPAIRGLFGVLEVLFDTSVLCTLSGLAILVCVPDIGAASGGMELLFLAFSSSLGPLSSALVALSVWAFAYSTVVCWCYYGRSSLERLVGRKFSPLFLPVFLAFVGLGAFLSETHLILLSDILLLLLSGITLPTLIKNSDRIVLLSESCGFLRSKESDPRKRSDAE
jgi:AGCS family alanine or glycine:cation symporter